MRRFIDRQHALGIGARVGMAGRAVVKEQYAVVGHNRRGSRLAQQAVEAAGTRRERRLIMNVPRPQILAPGQVLGGIVAPVCPVLSADFLIDNGDCAAGQHLAQHVPVLEIVRNRHHARRMPRVLHAGIRQDILSVDFNQPWVLEAAPIGAVLVGIERRPVGQLKVEAVLALRPHQRGHAPVVLRARARHVDRAAEQLHLAVVNDGRGIEYRVRRAAVALRPQNRIAGIFFETIDPGKALGQLIRHIVVTSLYF